MVPKLVLFKSHYLEGQSLFALSLFGIISTNMFVGKNTCVTLPVNMLVGFPLANWFWDKIHLQTIASGVIKRGTGKSPMFCVIPPYFPT